MSTRNELAEKVFDILTATEDRRLDRNVTAHAIAGNLLAAGWSKPRKVVSIEELDALRTGAIVRSKHGDIGSIDHGPHGNARARVHLLDFVMVHGSMSLEEFSDGDLPATVLFTPEATA